MNEKLKVYAENCWRRRAGALRTGAPALLEEIAGLLGSCREEEKPYFQFVLGALPLSDLGDYPPELLFSFVREGLKAREEFPWCRELPEVRFLLDVLFPRINTEELADCRGLFRRELEPRVCGLSLEKAILEVNRWCAEQAAYRSTDARTASPLAVWRCGFGRCGEESVFTVTALRSVGIAARQVYAPWWSHCDDNHAWVEAWDGERWRYLGACEPEPELDRGWFTSAASRAMMIHARAFLPGGREEWGFLFPETDPADLGWENGLVLEAVTRRYGEVRPVSVTVKDGDGRPVPQAPVRFQVLNMAAFREIAVRKTEQNGTARIFLGLGSVLVSAFSDGRRAEGMLDIRQSGTLELTLKDAAFQGPRAWDADFHAPDGASGYPAPLSPRQRQSRREVLDRCAALRENRAKARERTSQPRTEWEDRVLRVLTEKDRAVGVPPEIFDDAKGALSFADMCPGEVFESALLSPRVGLEVLRPWRKELSGLCAREGFDSGGAAAVRAWMEKNLEIVSPSPVLAASPQGSLRLGAADPDSARVLFCALCRASGIPARLSPRTGMPEVWMEKGFRPAGDSGSSKAAFLTLTAPAGQAGLSGQNFSLVCLRTGDAVLLEDVPAGESWRFSLPAGAYRLIISTRLPNGDQLVRCREFSLPEGGEEAVPLEFRQARLSDLLECLPLPPFSLWDSQGEDRESAGLLGKKSYSLLFWLEPGREPTEHILNELREAGEALRETGCGVFLILEDFRGGEDPALQKAVEQLPDARVFCGDFRETAVSLARRVYTDPDKLPLVLLTDCKGDCLYASSGYNVGTAELLIRLLHALDENRSG